MKPAWLHLGRASLLADPSRALIWPERELVVVADLHLEKGSSFARRGMLLPPYDTRATLTRLERVLARFAPRRVISLGDGFHDAEACGRLGTADRERLRNLTARFDWLWLTGNHDPAPPEGLGGRSEAAIEIDGVTFCHLPNGAGGAGEVAGHLHPVASIRARGRKVTRPCFVASDTRLILPAFGSYTGGLNVRDATFADLFPGDLRAFLLGAEAVHLVSRERLCA